MAYITAEKSREIRKNLKKAFPGWKFSVRNDKHTALRVNILTADIDFISIHLEKNEAEYTKRPNSISINHFWIDRHWEHNQKARDALNKINEICNEGNHDNSDIMTDYFDVGWYFTLSVGRWDTPFVHAPLLHLYSDET